MFHTFQGEALGQGIKVRAGQPTLPFPLLTTRATLESLSMDFNSWAQWTGEREGGVAYPLLSRGF